MTYVYASAGLMLVMIVVVWLGFLGIAWLADRWIWRRNG